MGQLSSPRRGGGSILPPQHLCMWVGVHRETVMMTIDINIAGMQIGGSLPPRSHAVPIVSLLTLAGDRFPFSYMCYYPRDGCDNPREVNPPPLLSPTPQLQYEHRPSALRAEAAIATPATPDPRLPGAEAGWRYALPPFL